MKDAFQRAAVGVLAAATLLAGVGSLSAPATADGWLDGGRITRPHDQLIMDSSTADVVVAVGTTGPTFDRPRATSTVARRKPNGTWTRKKVHIGEPVGVHVGARGNAVIVSVRNNAIVATTWRRAVELPRSRVVLRRADAPAKFFTTTSVANGRGDVAVLITAWPGYGDKAVLMRKPMGRKWRRPLTIGRPRYGGALGAVDIRPSGEVVATFKRDQTLSVRSLAMQSRRFGPASEVTTWPEIDDTPQYRQSFADVMVGRSGDLATSWSYAQQSEGGSELVRSRLNVVPIGGQPWQKVFEYADNDLELLAVGKDGSVLVRDDWWARRWSPATRRLEGRGNWIFRDANTRGDALVASGSTLRLWPVGQRPASAVETPRRRPHAAAVLTGDHMVYLAIADSTQYPRTYRLRIRQF